MDACFVANRDMYMLFFRKSDYLECAVLLCLVVCLTLLASSFLLSSLSLKHVLHLSLFSFKKLVCYAHVFPCA